MASEGRAAKGWALWAGARARALYITAFLMPLPIAVQGISIAAGAVTVLSLPLAYRAWRQGTGPGRGYWSHASAMTLFALGMAHWPFADDISGAWLDIERGLAFLCIPFGLWVAPAHSRERETTAWYGVAGAGLALALCLSTSAWQSLTRPDHLYTFFGASLTWPWRLHRVYLSIHLLVAIALVLHYRRVWWSAVGERGRVIPGTFWLLLSYLAVGVFLLQGRMAYLMAAAGLCGAMIEAIWRRAPRLAYVVTLAGLLAGGVMVARFTPRLWPPLPPATQLVDDEGIQTRRQIWQTAWRAITDKPLTGWGPGPPARQALVDGYDRDGFTLGMTHQYNAHQQWLQLWLELGLLGPLLWTALLLRMVWQALRVRSGALVWVVGIITGAALTEALLEAHKGAVLMGLIVALWPEGTRALGTSKSS